MQRIGTLVSCKWILYTIVTVVPSSVEDDRRPLNFGLATARRRAMDRLAYGVYSWMRLRPRDTLQRDREREREREREPY